MPTHEQNYRPWEKEDADLDCPMIDPRLIPTGFQQHYELGRYVIIQKGVAKPPRYGTINHFK